MTRTWFPAGAFVLAASVAAAQGAGDAAGDPAAGARAFKARCALCHEITQEKNKQGPHLVGVLGRKAGTVEGARYSKAMTDIGWEWDSEKIDAFLANPRKALPGTAKVIAVPNAKDRADVIAYLRSLQPDYKEE